VGLERDFNVEKKQTVLSNVFINRDMGSNQFVKNDIEHISLVDW
jgi:hypothetical protein